MGVKDRFPTPLLLLIILVLPTMYGCGTQPAKRPTHLVLVSIDGLRPEFYLDSSWPAPTLQRMAREGVRLQGVRGVFPSSTYPSHTTLVTGVRPVRHGVYYNVPFEPQEPSGRWNWEAAVIRAPTLWELVRRAGGTTASVAWPATVGAPIDWNVPEIWDLEDPRRSLAVIRSSSTPAGLWAELERDATGPLGAAEVLDWIGWQEHCASVGAYLLERYRPTLLTIHLNVVDRFQHDHGRDGPEVRRAVEVTDQAVDRLVEAARQASILDETAFVVTGDHGVADFDTLVAPNVWLVEAGLREAPDRGDWKATFHLTGGSAFLYLRDPEDQQTLDRVGELLSSLQRRERPLFRMISRTDLEVAGADPAVPLALSAAPGVGFSALTEVPAVQPMTGGVHGQYPDLPPVYTGLIGWGPGFRSGVTLPLIDLQDVAPLVASLLGMEFEAIEGTVPRELLDEF